MLLATLLAVDGIAVFMTSGGILAIDMHTTSVFLLAFPPLLILWKALLDDGSVNWVETSTMMALLVLTIYFLVQHA